MPSKNLIKMLNMQTSPQYQVKKVNVINYNRSEAAGASRSPVGWDETKATRCPLCQHSVQSSINQLNQCFSYRNTVHRQLTCGREGAGSGFGWCCSGWRPGLGWSCTHPQRWWPSPGRIFCEPWHLWMGHEQVTAVQCRSSEQTSFSPKAWIWVTIHRRQDTKG